MGNSFIQKIKNKIFMLRFNKAGADKKALMLKDKVYHMGENCLIYTSLIGTEPYLISIHDNVIVAANVRFLNHDISVFNVRRYLNCSNYIDKVGKIELFDNCFIGAGSILMPNCSVGKNSVIAAGSIVVGNIPDNEVWGGVPAKKIMDIDTYAQKVLAQSQNYPWIDRIGSMTNCELIRERQQYFFGEKNEDIIHRA